MFYICALLSLIVIHYVPSWQHENASNTQMADLASNPSQRAIESANTFYNANFANLVSVCSLLFVVFGFGLPFASYLLQQRSLKDERDYIMKLIDDKQKSLSDSNKEMQKQLRDLNEGITNIYSRVDVLGHGLDGFDRVHVSAINTILEMSILSFKIADDTRTKSDAIEQYFRNFILLIEYGIEHKAGFTITDSDIGRLKDAIAVFSGDIDSLRAAAEAVSPVINKINMVTLKMVYPETILERLNKELSVVFSCWGHAAAQLLGNGYICEASDDGGESE